MKVARVNEMQAMDKQAIEDLAIPEEILMENAGQAAVAVLGSGTRHTREALYRYLRICRTAGATGFVVARKIHSNGGLAQACLVGDETRLSGAARLNLDILKKVPVTNDCCSSGAVVWKGWMQRHCLMVDFRDGPGPEIQGICKEVIGLINSAERKSSA